MPYFKMKKKITFSSGLSYSTAITLRVFVIEASCLEFWNDEWIVFQRHVIFI